VGVPKPTEYERTIESKRLLLIAFRERARRKEGWREEERARHKHALPLTSRDAPPRTSATLEQMTGKEKRLMTLPLPPSHILRDTVNVAPGRVLEKMPGWVEEEVGSLAAAKMAVAVKELRVDAQLMRYFDHDSWKQLGVDDALVRCRLLRRQLQETSAASRTHAVMSPHGGEPGKGGGNEGTGHVQEQTVVEDFAAPNKQEDDGGDAQHELDALLQDFQAVSPAPGGGSGVIAGSAEVLPGQVGEPSGRRG